MKLGFRVFFVEGNEITRISQAKFSSFHSKRNTFLKEYAGKTIVSALVAYETENRKPKQIMRIDTQKIKIDAGGRIDEIYEQEELRLIAGRMDSFFNVLPDSVCEAVSEYKSSEKHPVVIEATEKFDERHWRQRHPELSGPVLNKIIDNLFGK